jgi:hypothetical protein
MNAYNANRGDDTEFNLPSSKELENTKNYLPNINSLVSCIGHINSGVKLMKTMSVKVMENRIRVGLWYIRYY